MMQLPRAECVVWLTAKLIQSLATVSLNVVTIIIFVSHRQVRKRSTYILISLAVADMLVGAVTVPLCVAVFRVSFCELWKYNTRTRSRFLIALGDLFHVVSLNHLVVVSLERLYVTLCPFKYRSVKDKAYGIVIAIVWLIPTLTMISLVFALKRLPYKTYFFIRGSYTSVVLFTICVGYLIIFIKVRCSSLPRRHGAANRERKLTITLFIVTAVSLLSFLPYVVLILNSFLSDIFYEMSPVTLRRIYEVAKTLCQANSLANPIIYTIRMPEFRKAASTLLCKKRRRRVEQIRVGPAPNICC